MKKTIKNDTIKTIHYVRNASGLLLSVYQNDTLFEQNIYGSSRLAIYKPTSEKYTQTLGEKACELSNHLGNVNVVISDNKYKNASFYAAFVLSQRDYYVYGQVMRGRTHEDARYRYAYNGKELEEDLGKGLTDFGGRILHTWGGFWLSVDPLASKYPMFSPYVSMGGNPILIIDPDGLRLLIPNKKHQKVLMEFLRKGLTPEEAKLLRVTRKGEVIVKSSKNLTTRSENFDDLNAVINSTEHTMVLHYQDYAEYKDNNGKTQTISLEVKTLDDYCKENSGCTKEERQFYEQDKGFMANILLPDSNFGKTTVPNSPSEITRSIDENINVFIDPHSNSPTKNGVVTTYHEMFWHGLRFMQNNKNWDNHTLENGKESEEPNWNKDENKISIGSLNPPVDKRTAKTYEKYYQKKEK